MIEPSSLAAAPLAVLLAALAAGNPPRRAASVPGTPPGRMTAAAAVAAVPLLILALGAGAVLDALAVSRPTVRVAAGLVLMAVGLFDVVRTLRPLPGAELGVVVPLGFPLLLRPEVALVALVAGADHGAVGGAAAVLVALAGTPLLAMAWRRAPESWGPGPEASSGPATDPWAGAARWLGALGVLVGAGLLLDGILAL